LAQLLPIERCEIPILSLQGALVQLRSSFSVDLGKAGQHPGGFLLIQQENLENPPYVWSVFGRVGDFHGGHGPKISIDFPKVGQMSQQFSKQVG